MTATVAPDGNRVARELTQERGMEQVVLLRRLLADEMNKWVSGEKMSAKWQALAFHVVEGSAAMLEMLEADALADLEAIERGEWDKPCRCCRREAYRYAPHARPRSGI